MIGAKRVVLIDPKLPETGQYYLSKVERNAEGKITKGYIENGSGHLVFKDGKVHGKDGNTIYTTWTDPGYREIPIPEHVSRKYGRDYNEVINWALEAKETDYFSERLPEGMLRGVMNRKGRDPEVAAIIDLGDNATVEFRSCGFIEYRWAFCRNHDLVRWVFPDTLEAELVRALVNRVKPQITKV